MPPKVPRTGAYLGAWVNPVKSEGEAAQVSAFAQATGSGPAVLSLFTSWNKPAPISSLTSIVAQGAIPLVAWGCASTAAVNAGRDDALITKYAESLKSFAHPVFLRWFWEMNLPVRKDVTCIGGDGPSGFVSAWRHVWGIFHQVGATNVALVWCPGVGSDPARMADYFPGASYVDWIAADGYDRKSLGLAAFNDTFGAWYNAYAGYGKPLMIAETGALAKDQSAYLGGIGLSMSTQFPAIKALVYFDAAGPAGAWQLVGNGLDAYRALGQDAYFRVKG